MVNPDVDQYTKTPHNRNILDKQLTKNQKKAKTK